MELLAGESPGATGIPVRALDAGTAGNQSPGLSLHFFCLFFMRLQSTRQALPAGRLISGS
jgi:hypothetical protein